MYYNKQLIAEKFYKIFEDLTLEDEEGIPIHISKFLTPKQQYSLIISIINGLPKTDFEMVLEFVDYFKVEQEKSFIISDFEYKELILKLILEEAIELAFSLGFSSLEIYNIFINLYSKVSKEGIKPSLTNITDALTDLLYVVYHAFYVCNLVDIQYAAMKTVHQSNMTKLVHSTDLKTVEDSISKLKKEGYRPYSEYNKGGYIVIRDLRDNKVLKPTTYKLPTLEIIINKYLKTKK